MHPSHGTHLKLVSFQSHPGGFLEAPQTPLEVTVRDGQHRGIHLFQEANCAHHLRQHVARFGQQLRRISEALGT